MVRRTQPRVLLRLFAILLFLALPSSAAAQPTPVTLYAHLINVQDFPLNAQMPDVDYVEDAGFGMATTQLTCLDGAAGLLAQGITSQVFYTWYGYITPTPVEYQQPVADGSPRTHPDRGVVSDVLLNATVPMELTWYLSMLAEMNPGGIQDVDQPAPLPIPNVVVRATLREGDLVSVDDLNYNNGRMLARGATQPVTLVADQVIASPPSSQVRALGLVDNRWVYEFRVPLAVDVHHITKAEGANLRVDTYLDNEHCNADTGTIQTPVFQHSSAGARPRLTFAIDNPFVVVASNATWVKDDLALTLEASSVWGLYDLDEAHLDLQVAGPGPTNFERLFVPNDHHHPHGDPVPQLVWIWPNATRAAAGHYEVTVTVPNLQGTAVLEITTAFDVAPARQSPSIPALVLVAGLLGLTRILRRL